MGSDEAEMFVAVRLIQSSNLFKPRNLENKGRKVKAIYDAHFGNESAVRREKAVVWTSYRCPARLRNAWPANDDDRNYSSEPRGERERQQQQAERL